MTSTAFDDQFAVCTPEEEEFFRERQAQQDELSNRIENEQHAEDYAVGAMLSALDEFIEPEQDFRLLYRAIKAGRIPGVVLGGGHE